MRGVVRQRRCRSKAPAAMSGLLGCVILTGCRGGTSDSGAQSGSDQAVEEASYVGANTCAECHEWEHDLWRGSHHDLAMQPATEESMLGDFDDAAFDQFGVRSRFFKRDDGFFVHTEGPDGAPSDFEITYTFGVTPLQQYLVAFPDGRYQVLPFCWDSRPAEEGGQRWFHIYPDEHIAPDDELFWTGLNQNWNYMCAECHSTNLQRGYQLEGDRYETTWSEIDVACESCHGPGSRHVEWARAATPVGDPRLTVKLGNSAAIGWLFDTDAVTAHRAIPRTEHAQMERCAPCHARRTTIEPEAPPGSAFLDTHAPALLREGLYHADGQILDEVYVYGSFMQSKMYHAGVTCSDCHDPHSVQLRAQGNALCARCHLPSAFDTPEHHHHKAASPAAQCVACHMPETTYMVVDPRRDHSLRVPRPDLSVKTGAPNACNGCHADENARWADATLRLWFGEERRNTAHFGEALHAGRIGAPDAAAALLRLIADAEQPGIARATALTLLPESTDPQQVAAVEAALSDPDALVRIGAIHAMMVYEPGARLGLVAPLLDDPLLAVRIEAAWALADVPAELLDEKMAATLQRGLDAYIGAQRTNAERPETHVNVGNLAVRRGDWPGAEEAFETALRLDPAYSPAAVNLADLYRALQRDADGEQVLRAALERRPRDAPLHHALGLLLVRVSRLEAAIEHLEQAVKHAPHDQRYRYVYAVALASTDEIERAVVELQAILRDHPADPDILLALASYCRQLGRVDEAIEYAETLATVLPDDPGVGQLLQQLLIERDR